MARERYLVGAGEETIHQESAPLTKTEERKNWWHYHKFIVLGIIAAALLVFSFVYSIVSQVKPDYQIAFLTSYALPEELMEEMENYITDYCDDRNEDGQVVVSINTYVLGNPSSGNGSEDATALQAAVARFTADCTTGESMIFLHDEDSFQYISQAGMEGFFAYNSGEPMPDDATDYENAMLNWSDVTALDDFMPASVDSEVASPEDVKTLLERYRISVRTSSPSIEKDEKLTEYYKDSIALYARLKDNIKLERPVLTEG